MTTFAPEMATAAARDDLAALRRSFARDSASTPLVDRARAPRCTSASRRPIIVALLQRGAFSGRRRVAVADTLVAFSIGLLPFSVYLFVVRTFTSRHDTRTPFLINCIENGVNIALAFALYAWLGIPGLALVVRARRTSSRAVVTLGVRRDRLGGIDGARARVVAHPLVAAGVVRGRRSSWARGRARSGGRQLARGGRRGRRRDRWSAASCTSGSC